MAEWFIGAGDFYNRKGTTDKEGNYWHLPLGSGVMHFKQADRYCRVVPCACSEEAKARRRLRLLWNKEGE